MRHVYPSRWIACKGAGGLVPKPPRRWHSLDALRHFARMLACALGEQNYTCDNENRDYRRSNGTAQIESAVTHRLVKKIANRGSERASEDKSCPKQSYARDRRPVVCSGKDRQSGPEHQRAAFVAEAAGIG